LTVNGFYTTFFRCQAENTLSFVLILRAVFEETVGNISACLWIILWKTLQVFLSHKLKIQAVSAEHNPACAKLQKSGAKKNFKLKKKLISGQFLEVFRTISGQNKNAHARI
jgi:hypothetical protein